MLKILALEAVAHSYGSRPALKEISFQIELGECAALVGPNGCGKSTLLRIAAGILRPSRGRALIGRRDPGSERSARRSIGYLGHELGLYGELTISEYLAFYSDIHGVDACTAVPAAMERFQIGARADFLIRDLSRGYRERTALARASLHQPALLLLDEPTSGLDAESSEHFRKWIADERGRGAAILFSTHEEITGRYAVDRVIKLEPAA